MNSSGFHVQGQFGHCSPDCPQEPVCGSLRVLDTDDDFASGLYSAARGRRSGGRPVWVDEANSLFIYWISAEAGWEEAPRGQHVAAAEELLEVRLRV